MYQLKMTLIMLVATTMVGPYLGWIPHPSSGAVDIFDAATVSAHRDEYAY